MTDSLLEWTTAWMCDVTVVVIDVDMIWYCYLTIYEKVVCAVVVA